MMNKPRISKCQSYLALNKRQQFVQSAFGWSRLSLPQSGGTQRNLKSDVPVGQTAG